MSIRTLNRELYSAERPELLGLMNIEGRQNTERLAYTYTTYIEPALAPIGRLLDHLATEGHTRPISLRTFTFLVAPKAATTYANETADLIINALRPEADS